jgi:hypothetical protein
VRILRNALAAVSLIALSGVAMADEIVRQPFANSALTPFQKDAWNYYVTDESAQNGCRYGDDERLVNDPKALLEKLAAGEDVDPVQMTLRTYMSLGPAVATLLTRKAYIASMECNPVYIAGDDLVGMPVIPFEEYLDILTTLQAQGGTIKDLVPFIRHTKVAAIDARWFWSFFIVDKDHIRLLGFDGVAVATLAQAIPGDYGEITAENVLWRLYQKVFSQGVYVKASDGCSGEREEPAREATVFATLPWDTVDKFYDAAGIPHSGKWRMSPKLDENGLTLLESKPVESPVNPYFNVTRGVTIKPSECKS